MAAKKNSKILPISACILAATLWGLLWYPLRILEELGMPGLWATLAIYIPALIIILPLYFKQQAIALPNNWLFLVLALAAGWTNLAFILAILDGTVVRVLLLFYLSPVWAVLLSRIFLREKISSKAYFHLCLALIGAVIILWQDSFTLSLAYADWLAISSGFAFALTNVVVRLIGDIPIVYKMLPAWVGVIGLTLVGLLISRLPMPEIQASTLMLAVSVGIFGMILMTYAAQYAVTHLPVHQSATLFLFEVPVGAVSAALLSHETMSSQEWLGGGLVMLAAWLVAKSAINHSLPGSS